jgi:hypothetical protein
LYWMYFSPHAQVLQSAFSNPSGEPINYAGLVWIIMEEQ